MEKDIGHGTRDTGLDIGRTVEKDIGHTTYDIGYENFARKLNSLKVLKKLK